MIHVHRARYLFRNSEISWEWSRYIKLVFRVQKVDLKMPITKEIFERELRNQLRIGERDKLDHLVERKIVIRAFVNLGWEIQAGGNHLKARKNGYCIPIPNLSKNKKGTKISIGPILAQIQQIEGRK